MNENAYDIVLRAMVKNSDFNFDAMELIDKQSGNVMFSLHFEPHRVIWTCTRGDETVRGIESVQTLTLDCCHDIRIVWHTHSVQIYIDCKLICFDSVDRELTVPLGLRPVIPVNPHIVYVSSFKMAVMDRIEVPQYKQQGILAGIETEMFLFDENGRFVRTRNPIAKLGRIHDGGIMTDDGDETLEPITFPEPISHVESILANRRQLLNTVAKELGGIKALIVSNELNISLPDEIMNRITSGQNEKVEYSTASYDFDPLSDMDRCWNVDDFYGWHKLSVHPEGIRDIDVGIYKFLMYMMPPVHVPEFKLKSFQPNSLYYGEESSSWIRWRYHGNGIEIKTNGLSEIHFDAFMREFIPHIERCIAAYDPDRFQSHPEYFRMYRSCGRFNIKFKHEDLSHLSQYAVVNPKPMADSLVVFKEPSSDGQCFLSSRNMNPKHVRTLDHSRLVVMEDKPWISMAELSEKGMPV